MRIAIISTMDSAPWGGSEELWRLTAEHAVQEGHQVILSLCRWPTVPSKVAALQNLGVKLQQRPKLGTMGWRQGVHNQAGNFLSPFRSLFALKPDVVCVSQGGTYDALILKDLRRLLYGSRIPYVMVIQSNTDNCVLTAENRQSAISLFGHAFTVVFVSGKTRKQTERQLAWELPNAVFMSNPVNLIDCSPVPWPGSEQTKMASVASLNVEWKSQDILFEVLGSRAWRQRDWKLNIFGDGPDKGYLIDLAGYFGIRDRVNFRGHVADVRSIWAENHVFVLPSRVESGPLALIEAMVCGRPSVATDVGGVTEWLEEPETGFVAEAPTVASFGAAMERAWAAKNDWMKIGYQANVRASAKRDPEPGKTLFNLLCKAAAKRQT